MDLPKFNHFSGFLYEFATPADAPLMTILSASFSFATTRTAGDLFGLYELLSTSSFETFGLLGSAGAVSDVSVPVTFLTALPKALAPLDLFSCFLSSA